MTRTDAPTTQPVTLTIAGSDSGGGAGIQADLKTMAACGTFGTSVLTAVTAQNTEGVESSFVVPTAEIENQLRAIRSDFDVAAIKTGMLATAETVELVAEHARSFDCPLVVDPVMVATSGDRLLAEDAMDAYDDLIAHATLVTPNTDEVAMLTGIEPENERDMREAGEQLLDRGCDAALLTGGHLPTDDVCDVLVTPERTHTVTHPRIDTVATHGAGCTLSSAITAHLGRQAERDDIDLPTAVEASTTLLERAIRYHHDVGHGPGAVHHTVSLRERAARQPVQEAVAALVDSLTEENVRSLVPEVGMNVVGATPYAETIEEIAAVEGRITKTIGGIQPNRGVRFGASSHMARFLLSLREHDPAVRFGVNCRFGDDTDAALDALSWPVGTYDRSEEPTADVEGSTMGWGAQQAFESVAGTPVAVVDGGAHGKEPIVKLLARDPETLLNRITTLDEEL
ncbi:bifunctional hydroxymethylpyrimidine kinase/phosphomethylpyrimidine kinase [Halocatena salina]|uniref:Bifunctional hydroxymethylpyrimidine kinase/phosphomethylpyrimidine kinase n=1 Tax=Halocatena salina TaxID=2934340 RepID=A0A8U0A0H1_9EURY|nr:bifunctional hydroxymethylpyrimidine kinase/phosphomethylpyrimidine kinase [Halocatena salina]UPM42574.1 bifunctional hydroxymethylpyrimidine kinase/phosphomethylpyrimidine kinase [Halocatena salina]